MAKKSFAVIGLGQFGRSLAEELIRLGLDVIAIDKDSESIKKIAPILSTAFVADSTDEDALKSLCIKDVNTAIIAFGSNKEASILTTVLLRDIGVPNIIVRVDDDHYISIMKKLGATEVVTPQSAAGMNLANQLNNDDYRDFYKLDSKYCIVSISISPSFKEVKLKDLNSKMVFGVNIVMIKRGKGSFVPGGNDSILPEDTIYAVGTQKEIRAFREALNRSKKIK